MFISEVKLSCQVKVNNIVSSLGFENFWLVPSMGSAGGILLMWKSHLNVQIITSSDMYISAMVVRDPLDTLWMLTGVYDPSNPLLKSIFWDNLESIGKAYWCIAGDFNAIIEQKEKLGGNPFASGSICRFRRIVDELELIDLGFSGNTFTWNNRRIGRANIQEMLNCGLTNSTWRTLFPHASVLHLPAINSDHKPNVILTNLKIVSRQKPFHVEAMWIRDPNVGAVISQAWQKGVEAPSLSQIMTKIKYTKVALKEWNRKHFCIVQTRIGEIKGWIECLQNLPMTE